MSGAIQPGVNSSSPSSGAHWPFLDLLRLGAALLVLFGHTRGLIFVSFQDVAQAGLGTKAFYFLTGSPRDGVASLFAVSGCVVGNLARRSGITTGGKPEGLAMPSSTMP